MGFWLIDLKEAVDVFVMAVESLKAGDQEDIYTTIIGLARGQLKLSENLK